MFKSIEKSLGRKVQLEDISVDNKSLTIPGTLLVTSFFIKDHKCQIIEDLLNAIINYTYDASFTNIDSEILESLEIDLGNTFDTYNLPNVTNFECTLIHLDGDLDNPYAIINLGKEEVIFKVGVNQDDIGASDHLETDLYWVFNTIHLIEKDTQESFDIDSVFHGDEDFNEEKQIWTANGKEYSVSWVGSGYTLV